MLLQQNPNICSLEHLLLSLLCHKFLAFKQIFSKSSSMSFCQLLFSRKGISSLWPWYSIILRQLRCYLPWRHISIPRFIKHLTIHISWLRWLYNLDQDTTSLILIFQWHNTTRLSKPHIVIKIIWALSQFLLFPWHSLTFSNSPSQWTV